MILAFVLILSVLINIKYKSLKYCFDLISVSIFDFRIQIFTNLSIIALPKKQLVWQTKN
jgi:hypothetical protein